MERWHSPELAGKPLERVPGKPSTGEFYQKFKEEIMKILIKVFQKMDEVCVSC